MGLTQDYALTQGKGGELGAKFWSPCGMEADKEGKYNIPETKCRIWVGACIFFCTWKIDQALFFRVEK